MVPLSLKHIMMLGQATKCLEIRMDFLKIRGRASQPGTLSGLRWFLDKIFAVAEIGSAFGMVFILILVTLQMGSRIFGVLVPGADDFAAYSVVAVIFLGLAPALKSGAHIRVMLILNNLPARAAWISELFSYFVATGLAIYFAYWAVDFAYDSYRFSDVSTGLVKTPMWFPHSVMGLGLIFFVLALLDEMFAVFLKSPEELRAQRIQVELKEAGEI